MSRSIEHTGVLVEEFLATFQDDVGDACEPVWVDRAKRVRRRFSRTVSQTISIGAPRMMGGGVWRTRFSVNDVNYSADGPGAVSSLLHVVWVLSITEKLGCVVGFPEIDALGDLPAAAPVKIDLDACQLVLHEALPNGTTMELGLVRIEPGTVRCIITGTALRRPFRSIGLDDLDALSGCWHYWNCAFHSQ